MLNTKNDRQLLQRLGLTPEDFAQLREWTTFEDPKEHLSEEIVRLAMQDYREAMARKVTEDPASEKDPLVAPAYLCMEASCVSELVSSQIGVRASSFNFVGAGIDLLPPRTSRPPIVAVLLLVLMVLGGGFYFARREPGTLVLGLEGRPHPLRSAATFADGPHGAKLVSGYEAPSALETLLLRRVKAIAVSSEPAGAFVVVEGAKPILLGKTPMALELYSDHKDEGSYILAKSKDGGRSPVLLRLDSPTLNLEFQAPEWTPTSRTLDFRTARALKVEMIASKSPEK